MDRSATEHLLLEVIPLGLLLEIDFDNANPGAATGLDQCKDDIFCMTSMVMLDSNRAINPRPFKKIFSYYVPRCIRHLQHNINKLGRCDAAIKHIKTMCEAERLALVQIIANLIAVDLGLRQIGNEHMHHIAVLCSIID